MKGGDSAEPPREVLSRFPRSRAAIQKLFAEDEEFRELCGDYADCLTILDQLRRQKEGAEERIKQYCELRVNLENELLSLISSPAGVSADHLRSLPPVSDSGPSLTRPMDTLPPPPPQVHKSTPQ